MKKAFTFAELMISLVLISVLSAILYPTILQFTPNTNKPLFKSAYRTLSNALSTITNSREDGQLPLCLDTEDLAANPNFGVAGSNSNCKSVEAVNDGTTPAHSGSALCIAFCELTNVVPIDDKDNDKSCSYHCKKDYIITSNGMRWGFGKRGTYPDPMDHDLSSTNVYKIWVDVNSTNNDLDNAADTINEKLLKGIFYYAPTKDKDKGIYTTEPTSAYSNDGVLDSAKLKAQDTFEILVNLDGEIVSMSPAAWANLEDNETTEQ